MPAFTPQREALARATFEKPTAAPPATDVQKEAQKIREEAAKKGPEQALELMRQAEVPKGAQRQNENNIGTEIGSDGKKPRTALGEQGRFDEAEENKKIAETFISSGYDGLAAIPGAQDKLKNFAKEAILKYEDAQALYVGPPPVLGPADLDEAILKILKNPDYARKLATEFQTASSVNLEDHVTGAKTKFDKAVEQEKAAKAGKKDRSDERKKIDGQLNKFALVDPTTGAKGAGLKDIEDIAADLPALNDVVSNGKAKVASLEETIQSLRVKKATEVAGGSVPRADAYQKELDNYIKEQKKVQDKVTEANKKIHRHDELVKEKAGLEARKTDLDKEIDELSTQLPELTRDRLLAQADYNRKQIDRTTAEKDYVKGLEDTFRQAAENIIQDEYGKNITAQNAMLEKEKQETGDKDKQKILDAAQKMCLKEKTKGKRTVYEVNKDAARESYEGLMDPTSGPKKLLEKEMLKGVAAGSPEETRIKEKLANDPEFVKEMQAVLAERVVTRYVQSGGKMHKEDIRALRDSGWGTDLFDRALKNRTELKNEIRKALGEGALDTNLWDKLKGKTDGSILKLLLILFGSVATVGTLPLGMALKSALKE